jgi:hypothetical protein
MRRTLLAWAVVLAAALPVHASTEAERLAALCRVWATAGFLDPDVVFGTADWDAALMHAIPTAGSCSASSRMSPWSRPSAVSAKGATRSSTAPWPTSTALAIREH